MITQKILFGMLFVGSLPLGAFILLILSVLQAAFSLFRYLSVGCCFVFQILRMPWPFFQTGGFFLIVLSRSDAFVDALILLLLPLIDARRRRGSELFVRQGSSRWGRAIAVAPAALRNADRIRAMT
jgi:signal transduction histidine kinase